MLGGGLNRLNRHTFTKRLPTPVLQYVRLCRYLQRIHENAEKKYLHAVKAIKTEVFAVEEKFKKFDWDKLGYNNEHALE